MSKLIETDITLSDKTVRPDIYASIFETEEMQLLQEKMATARRVVSAVLTATGLSIVHSDGFEFPTPGAISIAYESCLPQDIIDTFDAPYRTGAIDKSPIVKGRMRAGIGRRHDRFSVEFFSLRSGGNLGWWYGTVPSASKYNIPPAVDLPAWRARNTLLAIALAAEFAKTWEVDPTQ